MKKGKATAGPSDDKQKADKKGSKKWLVILVVAVVAAIAATAAASYFFFGRQNPSASHASKSQASKEEKANQTAEIGDLVVNLSDPSVSRYLRVKIVVDFKEDKKLDEEIKQKVYVIKDALIDLLRRETSENIQNPENCEAIKKQILDKINGQLSSGQIEHVYFSDFLVQ